jgi:hypothetical protein
MLVRSAEVAKEPASAADRRTHLRRAVGELPWLDRARLKYGPAVAVVDLSNGGAQIETSGHRLQPGSTVVVEIMAADQRLVVPAHVLRCHVAGLSPSPLYRGGLEFKHFVSFPEIARHNRRAPKGLDRPPAEAPGASRLSPAATQWLASIAHSGLFVPEREARASAQSDLPAGWHRLVVRYADGRLLKGYSQEFTASSGSLQVWPRPNAPSMTRITVPLAYLKAVFFVRDFEGDAEHVERCDGEPAERGRSIAVTFLDGEVLVGTTMSYRTDADGFFIRPVDDGSNNVRIFVASRAIRHVQFPK